MKFRINKRIAIFMAILVLSLALASSSFAADNYKNLRAWFGEIKIFHNNTPVQLKDKPFIVDGTTYLPVRSVSEMLGMDITWDGTNRHIGINDKPGTSYNDMLNKFIAQEIKIVELETKFKASEVKVKDLEAKLKAKVEEEKVTTLSDLEKKLNKDYGTDNRVNFDIRLNGTKDNVEVRIYVENNRNNYGWDTLSTNQKERYLQNIVSDIIREFKNAKVSGYVEDGYTTGKLTSFTVSTRGTVSLDNRYNDNIYSDLETYLNDEYGIYKSNNIININVSESSDVFLTLEVDRYYWSATYPTAAQQRVLQDMARSIISRYSYNSKYYNYNDVSGIITDNDGILIYSFEFNSNGTLIIR